ncbi:MAG TPA: hypothetical protein VF516_29435 [Kofleriaceae bacterium]
MTMDALRSGLIALVAVLGGCDVGEVPPGGGPGPDAGSDPRAQKFDSVVKPVVARCRTTGCHLTTPPATGGQPPNFYSYDTLAAVYKMAPGSTNIIITHVGDGQPHNAITYLSTAEKKTIADWIDGK